MSQTNKITNTLLSALDEDVFELIRPHLKRVEFRLGDVLYEAEGPITTVYFPQAGLLSLIVELAGGEQIEAAMVGYKGAAGTAAVLGAPISLNKTLVQIAGHGLAIEVDKLRSVALGHLALLTLLMRNEQALFAQAQQSAACNISHSVEQRMARWLLKCRDFVESDNLPLTQEYLATMLGVQRPTVSLAALQLKNAGLIDYRRGHVQIRDADALLEIACECYERIKMHYGKVFNSVREP